MPTSVLSCSATRTAATSEATARRSAAAALLGSHRDGSVPGGANSHSYIVAAILIRAGRVLLCHRSPDRRWFPGVWDLPGGHIEPGEARGAAIAREVNEELGVWIEPPHAGPRASLSTAAFEMQIWVVSDWSGEIINAAPWEHDQIAWFLAVELDALDLAHDGYPGLIDDALADHRAAGLESPAAESGP